MAKLVVNPGTSAAWEIELKPGVNTLGRRDGNDFLIPDGSVSGAHCQITVNGDSVLLKNLGSTNGTFVNGGQVLEVALRHGQRLRFGQVELDFLADTVVPAAPPPTAPALTPPPAAAPTPRRISVAPVSSPLGATPSPAPPSRLTIARSEAPAVATPSVPPVAVVQAESAPPATAEPPLAPPVPGSAVSASSTRCKYHPKSPALWRCPKCHLSFCDMCVSTRPVDGVMHKTCRMCSVACESLGVDLLAGLGPELSFFKRLPSCFVYPFKGVGIMFLIFGTFLFGVMGYFSGFVPLHGWQFKIILIGYTFAYMQKIVHESAMGDDKPSGFPDLTSIREDILVPCWQLVCTVAFCFGPAIALFMWAGASGGQPVALALAVAAVVLGVIYFPMAVLAVAMLDTVTALNPLLIIPSIVRVPLHYLVACLVLAGIVVMERLGGWALREMMRDPIVPFLITRFVALYFLTVEMRILGLLYFDRKQELGWLGGR